jgi:arylsulfatase A-like enzyme
MIREELGRQGIADNTVIIYTSDNGYICGSHGYASKVLPMEESARVPLMIFDPRSKTSGKKLRCDALTGNIDFAPTILELAGAPVPGNMDGKSLLPLVESPSADIRSQMAFMNVWGKTPTHSLTVLEKNFKYTYWWYGGEGMTPTEELFDTARDQLELKNLANDPAYKSDLERMRKNYDKELAAWKKQAVSYNNYQKYVTLFDRNIPWSAKEKIAGKPKKENNNKKDKKKGKEK